jgi:hypothetical protein
MLMESSQDLLQSMKFKTVALYQSGLTPASADSGSAVRNSVCLPEICNNWEGVLHAPPLSLSHTVSLPE